jgi:hypothetical protein
VISVCIKDNLLWLFSAETINTTGINALVYHYAVLASVAAAEATVAYGA